MKNSITIDNDGLNIYATLTVKANPIGKVVLGIIVLLLTALLLFAITNLPQKDAGQFALPLIILAAFILIVPFRYLIWNMFGKEKLLINTKSLSYSYEYGFATTGYKTIKFDSLGSGFEFVRRMKTTDLGKLLFYNYDKDTGLPILIYQTSVLVSESELGELDNEISSLFESDFYDRHGFVGFSQN